MTNEKMIVGKPINKDDTQTPPPSDTITIDIKGMEGLTDQQTKAINEQFTNLQKQSTDTIAALTKQINDLSKKVEVAQNKSEETQKGVLLDKLKAAKLDPEGFKTLDLKSLETVVAGIAKTNTGIILGDNKGKDDPSQPSGQVMVFNTQTGKREPFYK